jgi:phosphopantetheinyl transferase (holo-ACP synthase)
LLDLREFFHQIEGEAGKRVVYRLTSVRTPPDSQDLERLQQIYPDLDQRLRCFSSTQRLSEWVSSRCAMQDIQEMEVLGFNHSWSFSLSHTKEHALVCAIALPQDHPSWIRIGVDLETPHRKMSDRLITRVFTEAELNLPVSPLVLWTIKEASFKAFQEEGLVLPKIRVTSWDSKFSCAEVSSLLSGASCRVRVFISPDCVLSFALYAPSALVS